MLGSSTCLSDAALGCCQRSSKILCVASSILMTGTSQLVHAAKTFSNEDTDIQVCGRNRSHAEHNSVRGVEGLKGIRAPAVTLESKMIAASKFGNTVIIVPRSCGKYCLPNFLSRCNDSRCSFCSSLVDTDLAVPTSSNVTTLVQRTPTFINALLSATAICLR